MTARPRFVVRVVHGFLTDVVRARTVREQATAQVLDTAFAWRVVARERTEQWGVTAAGTRARVRSVEEVSAVAQACADALNEAYA